MVVREVQRFSLNFFRPPSVLFPIWGVSHVRISALVCSVRYVLATGTLRASHLPVRVAFTAAVSDPGNRSSWSIGTCAGDFPAACTVDESALSSVTVAILESAIL
jgi:hypothetical protein